MSQTPSVTAKIIRRLFGARAVKRLAHNAIDCVSGVEPFVLDAAIAKARLHAGRLDPLVRRLDRAHAIIHKARNLAFDADLLGGLRHHQA